MACDIKSKLRGDLRKLREKGVRTHVYPHCSNKSSVNLYLALITQMKRNPLLCNCGSGRAMISASVSWLYPRATPRVGLAVARAQGGSIITTSNWVLAASAVQS